MAHAAALSDPGARCGIDSIEIARIERLLRETPAEDLGKLFSADELRDSGASGGRAASLAARFAAKEATLKALGRGLFSGGTDRALREVEVVRDSGPPRLVLHGSVLRAAERAGVQDQVVSLTHDGNSALASVILVVREPRP